MTTFYRLAHFLREKFVWIWIIIERLNGILFSLRYENKIRALSFSSVPEGMELIPINNVPADDLVAFFSRQPDEAFVYFRPHGFDERSIKRLQRNKSFLGYVLVDKGTGEIAGYCFNRCFFNGQGFRGRMVDIDYRGKGLGTAMNRILNEVGFGIGLRLFETVSKENVASYRSALSASSVRVVKEMENNELYLEILNEKGS